MKNKTCAHFKNRPLNSSQSGSDPVVFGSAACKRQQDLRSEHCLRCSFRLPAKAYNTAIPPEVAIRFVPGMIDLHKELFRQLHRLSNSRQGDEMKAEIERSRAVTGLSHAMVSNGELILKAHLGVAKGLDQTLSDLEALNYTAIPLVIPSCAVDAPHIRNRVWIPAYSDRARWEKFKPSAFAEKTGFDTGLSFEAVLPDADDGSGFMRRDGKLSTVTAIAGSGNNHRRRTEGFEPRKRRSIEPGVARVANGVPSRVDRIRTLGEAVDPYVVYEIGRAIMAASFLGRI